MNQNEEFSAMRSKARTHTPIIERHNGPELLPYNPPQLERETEPIYVLYFKLKAHLDQLPVKFANPYHGRFREHIKNALQNVDTTPELLEAELYKIYLRLKKDGH